MLDDVEMHKLGLIAGLVVAVIGAALVPLPGPGYPILALGLVVAAASAMSTRRGHSKRP
ncbi:hypothetical protein JNB_12054 [Janibacter sp. HTCC2649]|nr:hypothetical protein JNB_12054 [Janibacter sp. HTCC2649]